MVVAVRTAAAAVSDPSVPTTIGPFTVSPFHRRAVSDDNHDRFANHRQRWADEFARLASSND